MCVPIIRQETLEDGSYTYTDYYRSAVVPLGGDRLGIIDVVRFDKCQIISTPTQA